jgi:hypothetical protein
MSSHLYRRAVQAVEPLALTFIDGAAPFSSGAALPLLPCAYGPRMGQNLSSSSVKKILLSWLSSWAPSTRGTLRAFSSHSWRRGGAQAARDAGVAPSVIHATGHWKDPSTMNRIYLDGVNTSIAGAVFPVTEEDRAALATPVFSSAPGALRGSACRLLPTPSPVASPSPASAGPSTRSVSARAAASSRPSPFVPAGSSVSRRRQRRR